MSIPLNYDKALEILIFHTIEVEEEFVVDNIKHYDDFLEWSHFVIVETVYGAAKSVQHRNSGAEMMKELRKLWDENTKQ